MTASANPARGMAVYASVLAALDGKPMTLRQLAEHTDLSMSSLYAMVPQLHHAGLIRVAGEVMVHRSHAVVYVRADGQPDAPLLKAKALPFRRWHALVIAFVSIVRELASPSTRLEVVEATGVGQRTVLLTINAMHAAGLVHVAGWSRGQNSAGKWAAQWVYGPGNDKPAPKPMTKRQYEQRRYRKRKRHMAVRVLQAFGPARASVPVNDEGCRHAAGA